MLGSFHLQDERCSTQEKGQELDQNFDDVICEPCGTTKYIDWVHQDTSMHVHVPLIRY